MSAVTDMTIKSEPKAEPIEVHDYDFKFATTGLAISMWPSLGDNVEESETGFTFRFPRLKQTQTVYKSQQLIGTLITKTARVPFDMDEFKRKQAELRAKHGKVQE